MGVQRFDHVAIAVEDLERAAELFQGVFGAEFVHGGDDDRLGMRTLQFRLPPGVKVELLMPVREDSYLRRFIDKHGPGFHHATLIVDDVEKAIEALTAKGFEVVDTDLSSTRWRETFVRPSSGFGTLIQLADSVRSWTTPATHYTVEDALAGRVVWRDNEARLREGERSGGSGDGDGGGLAEA